MRGNSVGSKRRRKKLSLRKSGWGWDLQFLSSSR
jgi:hypothetical protein